MKFNHDLGPHPYLAYLLFHSYLRVGNLSDSSCSSSVPRDIQAVTLCDHNLLIHKHLNSMFKYFSARMMKIFTIRGRHFDEKFLCDAHKLIRNCEHRSQNSHEITNAFFCVFSFFSPNYRLNLGQGSWEWPSCPTPINASCLIVIFDLSLANFHRFFVCFCTRITKFKNNKKIKGLVGKTFSFLE